MEKRNLSIIALMFILGFTLLFLVSSLNFVSATELNLKVTGTINGYSADVYLKTDTGASLVVDAYDMYTASSPDNYSQFYSSVGLSSLSIDAWNFASTSRTIDLVYHISTAQTGTLALTWDNTAIDTSTYDVTLKNYGDDVTYTTQVGSDVDMKSSSSYSTDLTGDDDIYVRVIVAPHATTPVTTTPSNGGGGGGGALTTTATGEVVLGNKFIDVYSGLNSVKTRKIEIYNQKTSIIIGTLTIPDKLREIVMIKDEDLLFTIKPGETKTIEVRVVSPEQIGVYDGIIIVDAGGKKQEIKTSLTVTKEELLFDAILEIPWDFKMLNSGSNLEAQINLVPMVENPRLDVTTNYIIKDSAGREFYKSSKTFLIEGNFNEKLTFPTENLPAGDYIVEMELIYPNGIAIAKSSFQIKADKLMPFSSSKVIAIMLGIGVLVILVLIIVSVRRYKKLRKRKR